MVDVGVAEHDSGEAAERGGVVGDRWRHLAHAGVEREHPGPARVRVGVADEVDVHLAGGEAAPELPDAVGDPPGRGGEQVARESLARVGEWWCRFFP